MRAKLDPEHLKLTDFFRWDFYSNVLEQARASPITQAFHQWKAENEHAWKLITMYAEECVRSFSRNVVADSLQFVLLQIPHAPFVHALAQRYDRHVFRALNEHFLTSTWFLQYIQWVFRRLLPPEDTSADEDEFPQGFHFPSFLETHLISGVSDFFSGEFVLPSVNRWVPMFHFRSPFPTRSIAAGYCVLSFVARGIGQLPGALFHHHGLAHWGNLISFTALNIAYITRVFYPSLSDGDSTDIANRSFKDADLYKALGVPSSAGTNDILKAYKRKSLELHPDRNVNRPEAERQYVQEQFKVVNEAKRILTDTRSRFIYDQGLHADHIPQNNYGEMFDGQGESFESLLRQLFSLEVWGLNYDPRKTYSVAELLRFAPPAFALSASALVLLPMFVQLNIAYWQHLASDSGSLMLRVIQRLYASVLL